MDCVARALVQFPGGAAQYTAQFGFSTAAVILHPGAGDSTLALVAPIDRAEAVVTVRPFGVVLGGSDGASYGVATPTDTTIQVTSVQEQAAGAASIPVDLDYVITVEIPRTNT